MLTNLHLAAACAQINILLNDLCIEVALQIIYIDMIVHTSILAKGLLISYQSWELFREMISIGCKDKQCDKHPVQLLT